MTTALSPPPLLRTLCALVAAAAVAASLGGCWFQESQAAAEPAAWEDVTADPPLELNVTGRHGGTLTWVSQGDIATFNPVMTEKATESDIAALVFEGLATYDRETWEYVPELAWKWESSADGLEWTFHLRKGVRFSDGSPFAADDVLFSYNAIVHEKVPNSTKSGFQVGTNPFPTVEALDDYTVRFTLPVVNAMIFDAIAGIPIMPAEVHGDSLDPEEPDFGRRMTPAGSLEAVVGTGPFRIVEYSSDERVVYERNPWYWKRGRDGARLPFVDRFVMVLAKDLTARAVIFLDGQVDMITDIQPTDYAKFAAYESQGWFSLQRLGLSLNTTWISFNQMPGATEDGDPFVPPHMLPLFQDKRFRRAVSHSVDREKLVRLFVRGKGEAIYTSVNRGNQQWYVEPERFPFDRAAADALLDEMGLTGRDADGFRTTATGDTVRFELMTNVENDLRVKVIAQIKDDLARVGVDVVLQPLKFDEVVNRLMNGHNWDCILLGWGSAVPPDPLNGKNILRSTGRLHVWHPQQESPVNDFEARTDALIERMDAQPDPARRKELYKELVAHITDGQPITYLYSANAYAAVKRRVRNVVPVLLRPQTLHNIEQLWIDESWSRGDAD